MNAGSHDAAVALMDADLNQNLRVDSGQPTAFHLLIQIGRNTVVLVSALSPFSGRWLQLPGDYPPGSYAIYAAWKGRATPDSPVTPFAGVVEGISATRRRGVSARRCFLGWWLRQLRSLSSAPLPGACHHHRHPAPENRRRWPRAFSQLARAAGRYSAPIWRAGGAGAVAGPSHRTAGLRRRFIFMRRVRLRCADRNWRCSTCCRWVNIHPQESLPGTGAAQQAQLRKNASPPALRRR